MHENPWKLSLRLEPTSKMPLIQKLYPSDCPLWVSTLALQQSSSVLPSEDVRQNAKKS